MRRLLFAVPLLLGLAALSPAASADVVRAREHNQTAKRLFSLGLFEQAATEYTRAFQEDPRPAFLFNLAQCHKRLPGREHLERAIFYYKSFLQNDPTSKLREHVEGELARLERQLRALAPLALKDTRPSPKRTPIYKRWWFWTLIGAAVAGATAGTVVAATRSDGPATHYTLTTNP